METVRALTSGEVHPVLHGKHRFGYVPSQNGHGHAPAPGLASPCAPCPGLQVDGMGTLGGLQECLGSWCVWSPCGFVNM